MPKNKDIRFIRVNGRIIPIRKKKDTKLKGAGQLGLAAGIASGSSFVAAKQLRKSEKLFNQAALVRGTRKLGTRGSSTSRKLAKMASDLARAGSKATGRAALFKFGGLLGTTVASSIGIGNLLQGSVSETTKETAQTVGSIGAALGSVVLFRKMAKISPVRKSLMQALKSGSADEQLAVSIKAFENQGRKKTQALIQKFERARRKANAIPRGTQMDLFKKPKKKLNLKDLLKGF